MIGAVINAGDRHPSGQFRISVFVEIAATDAGLVGDHNDRPPQLIGPETSQLEDPGDELELLRPMDVAVVGVDHAVTIEKKRADTHG